jgi:hypothetical protein
VAVNCWVDPRISVGLAGVTLSATSSATLTVKLVFADTPDPEWVAVIVVLPVAMVVAKPLVPAALLIVAVAVEEEDQVTVVVRS